MRYTIKRATLVSKRLQVVYEEFFEDENVTNTVTKKCDQIAHVDLCQAFDSLIPHLILLCEQVESNNIDSAIFNSPGLELIFPAYKVTSYELQYKNGIKGVIIRGTKNLLSGAILNLSVWQNLEEDAYPHLVLLRENVERCEEEVEQYLFAKKWGVKQEILDFESELEDAPKAKKKSKRKKINIGIIPDMAV